MSTEQKSDLAEEVAENATKLLAAIENLIEAANVRHGIQPEIADELLDRLSPKHRMDFFIDATETVDILTGITYNMLLELRKREGTEGSSTAA